MAQIQAGRVGQAGTLGCLPTAGAWHRDPRIPEGLEWKFQGEGRIPAVCGEMAVAELWCTELALASEVCGLGDHCCRPLTVMGAAAWSRECGLCS